MLISKINLWENNDQVTLTTYILDNSKEININKRPSIIIAPGGGFLYISDREAEPIAMKFAGEGYNTFVLRYTTYFNTPDIDYNNPPDGNENSKYPQTLFDLAKAVLTVRENAEKWSVDSNKIFLCGFSAGGWLAANLGVHWQSDLLKHKFNVDSELMKPNGMILGYPTLDFMLMKEFILEINRKSFDQYFNLCNKSLCGENEPSDEFFKELSPVNHVTNAVPPTFIWHTANDRLVSVRNSINFATELSKNHIPYELHIFEKGVHSLALCNEVTANKDAHINPEAEVWFSIALNWLKKYS